MLTFLNRNSRLIKIVVLSLIVVIGMYIRVDIRKKRGIDAGDEGIQIDLMKKPISYMVTHQLKILQSPLDYLLVRPFFNIFGENKYALAFPHLLIALLGFPLMYRMCTPYVKTVWGYIIPFTVLAFNSNLIYHSQEIRPYIVLAVLSIASFLVMKYIVENENPPLKQKILISVFLVMTLWYHFYGTVILFFPYLFHILTSRKNSFKQVFLSHLKYYGIIVALALLVWGYFTFRIDRTYMDWDTFEYIKKGIVPILKGVFGNLIGSQELYFLLGGFILAFILPHKDRWKQTLFFILMIFIPIALVFISCVTNRYWFIQRLFVWAMPSFAFLLGWQWDSLILYFLEKRRR